MIEMPPLNEITLARETLRRLSNPKSVLARAAHVLELVAHNSIGLGEVLQDFAVQGAAQINEIIQAAARAASGMQGHPEDKETLANIHYALKSVKSALEMIPAAMQRNKSDMLGEKEKLSRADVSDITHSFLHSPDVLQLLASENSGALLASLAAVPDDTLIAGASAQMQLTASH